MWKEQSKIVRNSFTDYYHRIIYYLPLTNPPSLVDRILLYGVKQVLVLRHCQINEERRTVLVKACLLEEEPDERILGRKR